MSANRLRAVLVTAIVSLALVAACGGTDGDGAAAPEGSAPTRSNSSTDLLRGRVLPSYAYREHGEKAAVVQRAIVVLRNDCLARFGFDPIADPDPVPPEPPMYRRYSVTDSQVAAEHGYHLDDVGQANTPDLDAPPPAWMSDGSLRLVLYGGRAGIDGPGTDDEPVGETPGPTYDGKAVPPGGCVGEAERALGGPAITDAARQLPGDISAESFERADVDPRVIAVTQEWSACMAGKGHDMRDPYDIDFDIEGPITDAERRTATDDVACKEETGLVDVWFDVESDIQDELVQQNLEVLNEVREAVDARVEKALEVVAGSGEQ